MTVFVSDPDLTIHVGDALDVLAGMPDGSVDCCATSPPYWGLRDYGTDGQLGLEATPDAYVANMVAVFREVRRVLADHGTLWLNLGSSYNSAASNQRNDMIGGWDAGMGRSTSIAPGYKPKDMIPTPWLVAMALQADGWYLRSDVIWSKPNPMPESVTDRPTKAHEYVFLLSKRPRYWFDQDAVREPNVRLWDAATNGGSMATGRHDAAHIGGSKRHERPYPEPNPAGRNVRSVWEIATQPYPDAHFACVDDQTEALTPYGWKRQEWLTDGDEIAIYDPDSDSCRFAPASFHRYPFDGELVAIEKRDSSQRLTPNHRCYIRQRSGRRAVVRADELKPGMEILTCAPLEGMPVDADPMRDYDADWAALTGWFVTEGHVSSIKRVEIYQSVSANPQHVETIRELLGRVGGDWSESTRHRAYLGRGAATITSSEVEFVLRGPLATCLQELAPNKRLNASVLALNDEAREALLEALIDGDGHRRSDGRACIVQKDTLQIEVMQALALSLGYRAVVSLRSDGCHVLYLTKGRWLTLRSTDGVHTPIGRERYVGTVWCPHTETGFWLARRNGRPFVTGNTFPEELPRRCILAGCPEWVCGTCGKARERIVDGTRIDTNGAVVTGAFKTDAGKSASAGPRPSRFTETVGWSDCGHANFRPGVVLDPFLGSGTTALVARNHGRRCVGIELNPEYARLASKRLQQLSLLADGDAA